MPKPDSFPKTAWLEEVKRGFDFYHASNRTDLKPPPTQAVVEYFRSRAPVTLDCVPVPSQESKTISFRPEKIPLTTSEGTVTSPAISFVASLLPAESSQPILLLNDMSRGGVHTVNPRRLQDPAQLLTKRDHPASACQCDLNGNGKSDLVISELGSFNPEDHDRGKVVWLPDFAENTPHDEIVLAAGLGRVADVQPADFDADGDVDLVVAEFGWHRTGRIVWLRNDGDAKSPRFTLQLIDPRPGTIHVPVVDLNHDGRPDFVALISQHFEVIEAFINQSDGSFAKQTIYSADDPSFGSSGIQVIDLDGDGDDDVLFTNGDMFDSFLMKPYHGIQWLENTGTFPFQCHRMTAFPAAMRAKAGDIDGDGDLDVVSCALVPQSVRTTNEVRPLDSLIWLEQSNPGQFIRHSMERGNGIHATLDLADFDNDGDLDIAVGTFQGQESLKDSAATIWWNQLRSE